MASVQDSAQTSVQDVAQSSAQAPPPHWLDAAKADPTRNDFLKAAASVLPSAPNIPIRIWAFAMVAPVEKLKKLTEQLKDPWGSLRDLFDVFDTKIKDALSVWQQLGTKESEQNARPEGEPPKKKQKTDGQLRDARDNSLTEKCLQRDNRMCALLGFDEPDVAHVIPFILQSTLKGSETKKLDKRLKFWDVLRMMYTPEQMPEILRAAGVIENPGVGLEQRVDNLICLDPRAHRLWSMGRFAFEPIPRNPDDQDRKQSLRFHWLPNVKHSTTGYCTAETHPEHENSLADNKTLDISILHGQRLVRIDLKQVFSGDTIDMTTDDPEDRPLPSYKLLSLQWDVQRLLHLQAGAGPQELSDDSDSDDDDFDIVVWDSDDESQKLPDILVLDSGYA